MRSRARLLFASGHWHPAAMPAVLTGANGADLVAFGTEAGLFQTLGTQIVICGPGSIEQAHKADEFVSDDQLQRCDALLDKLLVRLEAGIS